MPLVLERTGSIVPGRYLKARALSIGEVGNRSNVIRVNRTNRTAVLNTGAYLSEPGRIRLPLATGSCSAAELLSEPDVVGDLHLVEPWWKLASLAMPIAGHLADMAYDSGFRLVFYRCPVAVG